MQRLLKMICILLLRKYNQFDNWLETDINKLKKTILNDNNISLETLMINLIRNVPNIDQRNKEKQLVQLILP